MYCLAHLHKACVFSSACNSGLDHFPTTQFNPDCSFSCSSAMPCHLHPGGRWPWHSKHAACGAPTTSQATKFSVGACRGDTSLHATPPSPGARGVGSASCPSGIKLSRAADANLQLHNGWHHSSKHEPERHQQRWQSWYSDVRGGHSKPLPGWP